jgi:hypothetical protein
MEIRYHPHAPVRNEIERIVEQHAHQLEERLVATHQRLSLDVSIHYDLRADVYRTELVLHCGEQEFVGAGGALQRRIAVVRAFADLSRQLSVIATPAPAALVGRV